MASQDDDSDLENFQVEDDEGSIQKTVSEEGQPEEKPWVLTEDINAQNRSNLLALELMGLKDDDDNPDDRLVHVNDAVRELQVRIKRKKIYKDLGIYILFVILVVMVVFMGRDVTAVYRIQAALVDAFVMEEFKPEDSHIPKYYPDIGQIEEFWQWLRGPFYEAISATGWYNGGNFRSLETKYVRLYNRLLGGIRFRQLRVRPDSCITDKSFQPLIKECYWYYDLFSRDTAGFGWTIKRSGDYGYLEKTYNYTNAEKAGGRHNWGYISSYYPPGGFIYDVLLNDSFDQKFTQLFDTLWIDKETRAVFVQLNLVNMNFFQMVTSVVFMLEFDPGGGVNPVVEFNTFRIELYTTPLDFFRLFIELSFVCFLSYYTFRMVLEVKLANKHGMVGKYFSDVWNFIDALNLLIFVFVILMYFVYYFLPQRGVEDPLTNEYVDLERISEYYVQIYNIISLNLLLCFIKMFKYLRVNDRLSLLWKTMRRASPDLLSFIFIFLIVFLGFSFMGLLLFGDALKTFSSFGNSLYSCFYMILGDFPSEVIKVNQILGPIFFFLFVFLVFFIMLNMFLAIINDAYAEENARVKQQAINVLRSLMKAARATWKEMKAKTRGKKEGRNILSDEYLLKTLLTAKHANRPKIPYDELHQLGEVESPRLRKMNRRIKEKQDDDVPKSPVLLKLQDLATQIKELQKMIDKKENALRKSIKQQQQNGTNRL